MRHAATIEYLFVLTSGTGLILTLWVLYDAIKDRTAFTTMRRNGPASMVAENNVWQESFKAAKQGLMFGASLAFLFTSPPPPGLLEWPQAAVSIIIWIIVSSLMATGSIFNRKLRKQITEYLYERRQSELKVAEERRIQSDGKPRIN